MADTYYLSPGNPDMTNNCFSIIRSAMAEDRSLTVMISDKREARSQAQRRLQWAWYTQIANFVGEDKNRVRNMSMNRHAIPIFYRDNIIINGIYSADTIDAIRQLKVNGMIEHYHQLMRGFVSNISSNSFSVKQNTEYLQAIFNECCDQAIDLYVPRDCDNAKFQG